MILHYIYRNPTQYVVRVAHAKKGDMVIFSESYDRKWIATRTDNTVVIASKKYSKFFNSFTLLQDGDYTLEVHYAPSR